MVWIGNVMKVTPIVIQMNENGNFVDIMFLQVFSQIVLRKLIIIGIIGNVTDFKLLQLIKIDNTPPIDEILYIESLKNRGSRLGVAVWSG